MPRALLGLFHCFCSHPLADSTWGPLCPVPPGERAQIPLAASALPTAGLYLRIPGWAAQAAAGAQPRGCRLHGRVAAAGTGPRGRGRARAAGGTGGGSRCPHPCRHLLPGNAVAAAARPAWAAGGFGCLHIPTASSRCCPHSPARYARSRRCPHSPARYARSQRCPHSPGRDARSQRCPHSPARDARSQRCPHSPARDARSQRCPHSPARYARSRRCPHSPGRDARSRRCPHSPAHDARSRRCPHSPGRDARSQCCPHAPACPGAARCSSVTALLRDPGGDARSSQRSEWCRALPGTPGAGTSGSANSCRLHDPRLFPVLPGVLTQLLPVPLGRRSRAPPSATRDARLGPPGATGYPQGAVPHSAHSPVPSTGTPDSRRWHRGFLPQRPSDTRAPVPPGRAVLLGHRTTSTLQDAHRPEPPVPPGCRTQIPLVPPDTRSPNPSGAARDSGSRSPGATGTPGARSPPPLPARPRAPGALGAPGARSPPPLPARPRAPGAPRPVPASRCRPYPGAGAAALRFPLLPPPLRGLRRAPAPPLLSLKRSVTRGAVRDVLASPEPSAVGISSAPIPGVPLVPLCPVVSRTPGAAVPGACLGISGAQRSRYRRCPPARCRVRGE
ncbi:uncharacterized protein LOC134565541 [Prinia subflava]|uniref:uncharacterized protein LOC134565541 n=1 Tax=Prinia subflava TaxID=208062 RepID=UPI002FE1F8C5